MSNPAVHSVTAAVSHRMRGSSEPRMAIQAAAGRDPQRKSQHHVRERREALGERIKHQDRQRHGRQLQAQRIQFARGEDEHQRPDGDESPGEARASAVRRAGGAILVRGLRASISASSTRLNAMATERAATIATTIQQQLQPQTFAREIRRRARPAALR